MDMGISLRSRLCRHRNPGFVSLGSGGQALTGMRVVCSAAPAAAHGDRTAGEHLQVFEPDVDPNAVVDPEQAAARAATEVTGAQLRNRGLHRSLLSRAAPPQRRPRNEKWNFSSDWEREGSDNPATRQRPTKPRQPAQLRSAAPASVAGGSSQRLRSDRLSRSRVAGGDEQRVLEAWWWREQELGVAILRALFLERLERTPVARSTLLVD